MCSPPEEVCKLNGGVELLAVRDAENVGKSRVYGLQRAVRGVGADRSTLSTLLTSCSAVNGFARKA